MKKITIKNNYDVGFCRPPKATQFKSGQSGNKKGRGKGVKNTNTVLLEIADQKIPVQEGGKTVKMSKRACLVAQVINRGIKGIGSAPEVALKNLKEAEAQQEATKERAPHLSRNARETLDQYLAEAKRKK